MPARIGEFVGLAQARWIECSAPRFKGPTADADADHGWRHLRSTVQPRVHAREPSGRRRTARTGCGRFRGGARRLLAAACGCLALRLFSSGCVCARLSSQRFPARAGHCRLPLEFDSFCGRLRQLALDLNLGLPPMMFGSPFAAAVAFPNRVGAHPDALFLVAHSIDPDQRRPAFPCKADAIHLRIIPTEAFS